MRSSASTTMARAASLSGGVEVVMLFSVAAPGAESGPLDQVSANACRVQIAVLECGERVG